VSCVTGDASRRDIRPLPMARSLNLVQLLPARMTHLAKMMEPGLRHPFKRVSYYWHRGYERRACTKLRNFSATIRPSCNAAQQLVRDEIAPSIPNSQRATNKSSSAKKRRSTSGGAFKAFSLIRILAVCSGMETASGWRRQTGDAGGLSPSSRRFPIRARSLVDDSNPARTWRNSAWRRTVDLFIWA